MNRPDSPFGEPDYTRDGIVLFGKYKGLHVYELPADLIGHLIAHYKFNLAVVFNHKTKPTT
jgi:hypothetical protein